jgi:hypothetical protein
MFNLVQRISIFSKVLQKVAFCSGDRGQSDVVMVEKLTTKESTVANISS